MNLEDFEQIDGTKVAFLGGVPKTFYSGLGMKQISLSIQSTYLLLGPDLVQEKMWQASERLGSLRLC